MKNWYRKLNRHLEKHRADARNISGGMATAKKGVVTITDRGLDRVVIEKFYDHNGVYTWDVDNVLELSDKELDNLAVCIKSIQLMRHGR